MTWIKNDGTAINSIEDFPDGCFGFVYLIETESGKKYIGKKQLVSIRKKKFGKKKLAAMTDKRLKPYDLIEKESDWKNYYSSSDEIKEEIKNGVKVTRTVIDYAFSKYHLTYLETKYQFIHGVIENELYLNDNILGKFYPSIFDFNEK